MNVLERVKQIVAGYMRLPEQELSAQTRLQDIGVQSIDILELAFALEKEFDIDLPFNLNEENPNWFTTIGDIAEAIGSVTAKSRPSVDP
jgi:acyl carrier protein